MEGVMSADIDTATLQKYPTYGLYFRRYAPFGKFGGGNPPNWARSEGDKRTTASTSLKVTARTYGCVMFNEYGIVYRFAGTTGTLTYTVFWGDIVVYSKVSMTVVRSTLTGPSLFGFSASTAG